MNADILPLDAHAWRPADEPIILTAEELAEATRIAHARMEGNAKRGSKHHGKGTKREPRLDVAGTIGESAYGKWRGISPIGDLSRPDDGVDFEEDPVDAKCSPYWPAHLRQAASKPLIRALVVVQFSYRIEADGSATVQPMGWTTRAFWARHHFVLNGEVQLSKGERPITLQFPTRILPAYWLWPLAPNPSNHGLIQYLGQLKRWVDGE